MNDAAIQNTPCQIGLYDTARSNKQSSSVSLITNSFLRCDCPWKPSGIDYEYGIIGLHKEIKDFYRFISPTVEEQTVRELVVLKVKDIIHSLWPDCQVDVFGSFSTGLYLPTSDIDMVIFGRWEALPLYTLERKLMESGLTSNIKVPIVKITEKDTELRVDISFNMVNSVRAADLIKRYIRTYPCLPYLVLILKQFLLQRDLNEVWTGGLSSYALILMSVRFLQDSIQPHTTSDQINLGSLLVEFFELYGRKFNYETTAIRVLDGGCYVRKDLMSRSMDTGSCSSILCIEDPLCPSKRSYAMFQVKRAFEHAYIALSSFLLPHYFNHILNQTAMSRIINIPKNVIEKRQRISDYANRLRMSLQSSMAIPIAFLSQPVSAALHDSSDRTNLTINQSPFSLAVSTNETSVSWSDVPLLNSGLVSTSNRNGLIITTSVSTTPREAMPTTFCHPFGFPTAYAPQIPFSRLPVIGTNISGTHLFFIGGTTASNESNISDLRSATNIPSVSDTLQTQPDLSTQSGHQMSLSYTQAQQPILAAIFSHLTPSSPYFSPTRPFIPFGFGFPSQTAVLPVPHVSSCSSNVYALLPFHPPTSDNTVCSFKVNDQSNLINSPLMLHALAVPIPDLVGSSFQSSQPHIVSQQLNQCKLSSSPSPGNSDHQSSSSSGTSLESVALLEQVYNSNPRPRGQSAEPLYCDFSIAAPINKGRKNSGLRRVNSEKSIMCCEEITSFNICSTSSSIVDEGTSFCNNMVSISSQHSSTKRSNQDLCNLQESNVNKELLLDNCDQDYIYCAELESSMQQPATPYRKEKANRASRVSHNLQANTGFINNETYALQPRRRTLRRPHQSPSLHSQPDGTNVHMEADLVAKTSHDLAPALAGVDLASHQAEHIKSYSGTSYNSSSLKYFDPSIFDSSGDIFEVRQTSHKMSLPHSQPRIRNKTRDVYGSKAHSLCTAQISHSGALFTMNASQLKPEHKRRCSRPLSPSSTISSNECGREAFVDEITANRNDVSTNFSNFRLSNSKPQSNPSTLNESKQITSQVVLSQPRRFDNQCDLNSTGITIQHKKDMRNSKWIDKRNVKK